MRVFEKADPRHQFDELAELHHEYFGWAAERIESHYKLSLVDLLRAPLTDVISLMIHSIVSSPTENGVFYLIKVDDRTAGMGGLHTLGDGASEIVRLYVRPEFRGARHGEALTGRLIEDARAFGFAKIQLSSARFMTSAHRIYEALGFVDCEAYDGAGIPTPLVPHMRFMERHL